MGRIKDSPCGSEKSRSKLGQLAEFRRDDLDHKLAAILMPRSFDFVLLQLSIQCRSFNSQNVRRLRLIPLRPFQRRQDMLLLDNFD
jgi:hypothetical protein